MTDDSIEKTNSGVKKKGSWKDIVEFGERVESILGKTESKSIKEFGSWRPKFGESENDIKKKTVDEAVVEEKKIEKESSGVKKDWKNASGEIAKAGKKAADKELPNKEVIEASEDAAKPFYSKLAGLLWHLESKIYSLITTRLNPYYLDTEDFSVDIKHKKNDQFEMAVSVLEDEKRKNLQEDFNEE